MLLRTGVNFPSGTEAPFTGLSVLRACLGGPVFPGDRSRWSLGRLESCALSFKCLEHWLVRRALPGPPGCGHQWCLGVAGVTGPVKPALGSCPIFVWGGSQLPAVFSVLAPDISGCPMGAHEVATCGAATSPSLAPQRLPLPGRAVLPSAQPPDAPGGRWGRRPRAGLREGSGPAMEPREPEGSGNSSLRLLGPGLSADTWL